MSEPEFISVLRTESENGHEAKIIEYNQYFFVVCDPCNFSMPKGTSHLDAANYILDHHINNPSASLCHPSR